MIKKAAASKGIMGTVVQTGVGAAAYFAAAQLGPKISFLQGRWWALPTALVVAGHLTKRWSPETGGSVVGAGGALLGFSYYVSKNTTQPTPTKAAGYSTPYLQGEAGQTAGRSYGDAGALQLGPGRNSRNYTRAGEAGALVT